MEYNFSSSTNHCYGYHKFVFFFLGKTDKDEQELSMSLLKHSFDEFDRVNSICCFGSLPWEGLDSMEVGLECEVPHCGVFGMLLINFNYLDISNEFG